MTLIDRAWLRSKRFADRFRAGASIDFDLQINLHGRHSAFLLWALTAHHLVRVRDPEANLLRHMLPLTTWLRRIILDRATPDVKPATVTLVDDSSICPADANKRAKFDDDWFRPVDPTCEVRVPYFMHPRAYQHDLMRALPGLRHRPSRFLLGFAGSISSSYGRVASFGILTRPEVLAAAQAAFGARSFNLRQAAGHGISARLRRGFVSSLTDLPSDTIEKHALKQAQYFRFVAECDFFLCPPGWTMPPSHNIIEAMSVGTIPVLNYPDFFDPPLRDGVECLVFATVQDLAQLPARLDALSQRHIESMRAAALAYYDRYLDGGAFARALLEHPGRQLTLLYNSEGGSIAKRDARAREGPP